MEDKQTLHGSTSFSILTKSFNRKMIKKCVQKMKEGGLGREEGSKAWKQGRKEGKFPLFPAVYWYFREVLDYGEISSELLRHD